MVEEPLSYWHDSLAPDDDGAQRAPLSGDSEVDVAIIGAGFTGLWTAHSLLVAKPSTRVLVIEKETAGFGASGRNGGWCVGMYSGPAKATDKAGGRGAHVAMSREMHRSVDEVGAVVASAGIDCGFHKGGALDIAITTGQRRRLRKLWRSLDDEGLGDAWQWLDARDLRAVAHCPLATGAVFTPHAAAVHPARLARGLATEVERLGGKIVEGTAARVIEPGEVHTDRGTVRADIVVRATEAYSGSIEGHERELMPLGNYVIATEPLDDATWAEVGLNDRQLFELSAFTVGYGQRTADGRIVWGGLDALTWFGDRLPPSPMEVPTRNIERLRRALVEMFPVVNDVRITHRWGGVMGVPRSLLPGIGIDRSTGFAWAGGYTGQGVATANAAGRGLADLILERDTDLTRLPWVGHRSRRWEPEPLRTMAVRAVAEAALAVDLHDLRRARRRRPSP
jgi:glycine/D-amino acid oxidase-like deaminating enzyme